MIIGLFYGVLGRAARRRVTLTPLGVLDDAAGQCSISPVAQIKVLGLVGGPGS